MKTTKRTHARLGALLLAIGLLATAFVVPSGATLKPGDDTELTQPLDGGEYTVVLEPINTFVVKLWCITLADWSLKSAPVKAIVIDESDDDNLVIAGGEKSLQHLQVTVDEEAKEVRIGTTNPIFWWFASNNITITLGVPVKALAVSTAGAVAVTYDNASVGEFTLNTDGEVSGDYSFDAPLTKLTANLKSAGTAKFTGAADEVVYTAAGQGYIDAYGLKASKADITSRGNSRVEQYFAADATELIAWAGGYSTIWYDFALYNEDEDPGHTTQLAGPTVYKNTAEGGSVRRKFVVAN
ncbi:MAG: DUF2807 domain-containing protein [Oscillospiraceae bacterium]|jgi:hypothetical protein|nr:DUF2807 domain-containing protein [Oscillospiraceae bacterium]